MKKMKHLLLASTLISTLHATHTPPHEGKYVIMLGLFDIESNAKRMTHQFPHADTRIINTLDKDTFRYYAIIQGLKDRKIAFKKLKNIKTSVSDAFVMRRDKLPQSQPKNTPIMIESVEKNSEEAVFVAETNSTDTKNIKIIKAPKISEFQDENSSIGTQENLAEGILLKDAILLALQRSNKILAAREKVIQAKRKVDEKEAAFRPKLDLYTNGGGAYLHPYKSPEEKFWKSDESLVLNQNLYAGGKHIFEVKREKANLLAAQEKFRDKVEEESVKIIDAYLSLIYQQKSIKATRNNMKSLKKILDIVSKKERLGAATKGDLNYIKSQVENASSALVKAESKYQNALAFYTYYVGELTPENMPIEEHFEITLEDEPHVMAQMKAHNAKLSVATAKLEAEKHNLRAQKSKFHPTLDLSITAKDKQSGYQAEPQEDRVTGLISMNYNLYNGGKDKSILLNTKSKISELRYKLIDTQEGSEYNIKQLYQNVLSTQEALKHTKKELLANKNVVNSYWAAFKFGTQDIQALLLAQRALNRAEIDVIKEKQAYINGYFKLIQNTGTLMQTLGLSHLVDADKIIQDKSINYFY